MSKLGDDPISHPALRPLSLLRMLWKQKFTIVAVWLLLSVATVAVIVRLPVVYRAETLILVDSQKIPEKFVSATVSADLREQLAALNQEILTSSQLLKIIENFNLYPEQRRSAPIAEVLEKMRSDLQVRVEERPGAFRVSLQGNDPVVVTQVVNQVGSLFVNENLRTRERHAEGTREFIQNQLDQAKKTLDEQESRIGQYKLEHNGELPEQEAALTASLAQLNIQLQGNQEAINRAYANQATLQSGLHLAETVAQAAQRLSKKPSETDSTGAPSSEPAAERPEEVVKAMEAELASLTKKLTDSHPRVKLLKASIERLKALEEKEKLSAEVDPEHVETLKAQLAAVDREIHSRNQENRQLLEEIHKTQSRLSRIPIREQEMAALTRDYEMSKTNYKSLLDKLYAADMAADMERREKAERFTILEPARVPQKPVKPNRALLGEIGGVLSLAAGLLVGLVRELSKNHILGEWELPAETPVYGRVPLLGVGTRTQGGVRLRLRTRGHLDSFVRSFASGRHRNGDHAAAGPIVEPTATGPVNDLSTVPSSPALGPQHASTLSASVRRTTRAISPASPVLYLCNPDSLALEQYRIARTKIEYDRREPRLAVVSSACAGDGKTVSAINLATVFAMRSDLQILLIEADFRHSCLAEFLGIPARPGLTEVLSGRCDLSEAIVYVEQLPNLGVLPAGACVANVTEMLAAPAWDSFCASVRKQFAYALFDAPPIGPVADYELIEKNCDGVVMVVRPDHTDRTLFQMAHGLVLPDKMLGVLMNEVDDWVLWRTPASYYGYQSGRT